jgi:hypothetical protein
MIATVRQVVWALSDRGRCPGRDFFGQLGERERHSAQALFDQIAEREQIFNTEKFRRLRGGIWELKPQGCRFTCFFDTENRLVVVDGFKKQRRKAPEEEIKRAEEVANAYDP